MISGSIRMQSTESTGGASNMDESGNRRSRRIRRVGLIGLPNSGKTSWQYSLLKGGTKIYRGSVVWIAREVSRHFNEVADKTPGSPQEATAPDTFTVSDLVDVERRPELRDRQGRSSFIHRWLRNRSVVRLQIPEVSGETVLRIARGDPIEPGGPIGRYLAYLAACDTIIGFASIDGGEVLNARRIDEVMLGSMNRFEAILGEVARKRPRGSVPAVVTILLTKVDLL